MILVDSSSWVKNYVPEEGTQELNRLLRTGPRVFASWLLFSECLATFSRLKREAFLSPTEREFLQQRFVNDWKEMDVVNDNPGLEATLVDLHLRQPLRGADAVHLASAIFLRDRGFVVDFVCSDRSLANMARAEGFGVLTPGLP